MKLFVVFCSGSQPFEIHGPLMRLLTRSQTTTENCVTGALCESLYLAAIGLSTTISKTSGLQSSLQSSSVFLHCIMYSNNFSTYQVFLQSDLHVHSYLGVLLDFYNAWHTSCKTDKFIQVGSAICHFCFLSSQLYKILGLLQRRATGYWHLLNFCLCSAGVQTRFWTSSLCPLNQCLQVMCCFWQQFYVVCNLEDDYIAGDITWHFCCSIQSAALRMNFSILASGQQTTTSCHQ